MRASSRRRRSEEAGAADAETGEEGSAGGWVGQNIEGEDVEGGGMRRATETEENDGENASESPGRRRGQTKMMKMDVPGGEGDRLDDGEGLKRRTRRQELAARKTSGACDEETETLDEGSRRSRRMAGWMDNV